MLRKQIGAFSAIIGFTASCIAVAEYGRAYVLTWVDRDFYFTGSYATRMREKANNFVFSRLELRATLADSEDEDRSYNHDVRLANEAMFGLSWCLWLRVCSKSYVPQDCRELTLTYRNAYVLWQFRPDVFQVRPSRHWEYVARRCDWNGYEYPILELLDPPL